MVVSAEEQQRAEELGDELPATLPVLPLKETVVFPESMTPLAIGQERSIRLIDHVVGGDRLLALVTVQDEDADPPGFDDLYEIGTAAVVHKMIRVPDGTLRVLVQGIRRVRLVRQAADEPYLVGEFVELPDEIEETRELEALTRNVQGLFARIIGLVPYLPEELQLAAANVDDPSALCHLVASTLRLKTAEKQQLLEEASVEQRLREVSLILNRELEVFELGTRIQSQVQAELEKGQREFFLRQQLKTIQEELGEGDPEQAEVAELRERLEKLELPPEVEKAAMRELGRLERLPAAAAEYGVIRTYLDWIATLPWGVTTTDNLDLAHAREVLDEDHYDLEKVKDRIIEHLAVSKLRNDPSGQILCFVGPPGVGKTSLGEVDRAHARAPLLAPVRRRRPRRGGGARPPAHVHRRDARLDHSRAARRGVDESAAPDRRDRQARRRRARRSRVGDARGARPRAERDLPRPLPRRAVRPLEGALHLHREHGRHHPRPAARPHGGDRALGLHRGREARDRASGISCRSRSSSTGSRPSALTIGGRRAAPRDPRLHARGGRARSRAAHRRPLPQDRAQGRGRRSKARSTSTRRSFVRDLGPRTYSSEVRRRTVDPGVATGLAYTAAGGDVLFIEAAAYPGTGKLTITGQLGDVMRESAQAALSWVRSHADRLALPDDWFAKHDVHVHVPAGAIPKDGPSAGITMATAIASLVRGLPVSNEVGMTGEITLTGQVLPVGGVREKILAAQRAGLKRVILPSENEPDLDDLPPETRRDLEFILVDSIEQVFEVAFDGAEPSVVTRPRPVVERQAARTR